MNTNKQIDRRRPLRQVIESSPKLLQLREDLILAHEALMDIEYQSMNYTNEPTKALSRIRELILRVGKRAQLIMGGPA